MIGVLQEGFLLHPVAIEVGIVRQLAIFLQHLRSIAAGAAVYPVELLATTALRAIVVTATASAIVVVIIIIVTAIAIHIVIQG
jgi:hypothetical protein